MSKLPMARGVWTVGLALSIAAFSVFPLTGALAKGNNPHKPHSNAFKAHPYRSGKCNGKRCTKPGDGWASRVNGSPESGAEQLTSWYYGYGGLNFAAPSKNFTFSDLKTLQTDYAMTWGILCRRLTSLADRRSASWHEGKQEESRQREEYLRLLRECTYVGNERLPRG